MIIINNAKIYVNQVDDGLRHHKYLKDINMCEF